jgi:alpha-beta hydrolase superfamily lysophospholipase
VAIGLAIGGLVYLLILLVVAYAATHPARSPMFLSPAALGEIPEEIEFASDGITLRGWWLQPRDVRGVAVLCHGYVMNRSENAALAVWLLRQGFACLAFDFRASGLSDGKRTGVGWSERRDVLAACRYAETRLPGLPRLLVGSSMGAAACAFAAAEDSACAAGAILDSSYSSLASATLGWWRFIGGWPAVVVLAPVVLVAWPLVQFNPFRVSVARALTALRTPVRILHGRRDRLAGPAHAVRNAAAAGTEVVWFEGAGHSEARWCAPDEYLTEILAFVDSLEAFRPRSTV